MPETLILDLDDCTEYRLALQVRPPAVVHGTLASLVALLGVTLTWSAVTHADLVVRAQGRVRPVTTPRKVFVAGRGEMLSASAGGQVVEVNFRQGDRVARGAVLVRLGTERLDNEIAKQRQTIRAAEEELARIDRLGGLLEGQARGDPVEVRGGARPGAGGSPPGEGTTGCGCAARRGGPQVREGRGGRVP